MFTHSYSRDLRFSALDSQTDLETAQLAIANIFSLKKLIGL